MKPLYHALTLFAILTLGTYVANTPFTSAFERICVGVLFIIVNGYTMHWTSYMQKKGEHLATKEDIARITTLTEEIRHEVALVNDNRLSFQTLRRESLINCYEKHSRWVNCLLTVRFENINYSTAESEFEQLVIDYNNSLSRLKLFDAEFAQYESLINSIGHATLVIQANYLLSLYKYIKFDDEAVRQKIASDYYFFRSQEYEKLVEPIKTLTEKFRTLISSTISKQTP